VKWFALAGVSVALALAAACGGNDDATPTDTAGVLTPVGTKDATLTPLASDGDGPPVPADPTLDEELTELTYGEAEQTIEPGASWPLQTLEITTAETGTEPSCGNFAFDFTWQVQDPYPPDAVDLAWQFTRDGSTFEVAAGPAGEQAVGCGLLEALNRGSGPVTVAIRYRAGAIE
jgi:hypothetical protein